MADFHRILGVSRNARPHHAGGADSPRAERRRAIQYAQEGLSQKPEENGCPSPDAWLADEVAIDFPSAHAIFERIREAFVRSDDPPACHHAEIELTRDQARRGITVPLDVPLRAACPLCAGRGERWMERCQPCAGTGESRLSHTVRLAVPAGIHHGAQVRLSLTAQSVPPTIVNVRIAVR